MAAPVISRCIWGLLETQPFPVETAISQKEAIELLFYAIFCLQTTTVYHCNAVESTSHRSKAKTLQIYPFMADVMWIKYPKDLSVQREKNVNMLNSARNFRLCSCDLNKEIDQHWLVILSILPAITGGSHWCEEDQRDAGLRSPRWERVLTSSIKIMIPLIMMIMIKGIVLFTWFYANTNLLRMNILHLCSSCKILEWNFEIDTDQL